MSEWALCTQADWGEAERLKSSTGNNVRNVGGGRCLLRRSADRWCWRVMRKSMGEYGKKVLEQLSGGWGADTRGSGTVTHGNIASDERSCVCDYVRICNNGVETSVFSVRRRLCAYFEFNDGDEDRVYV